MARAEDVIHYNMVYVLLLEITVHMLADRKLQFLTGIIDRPVSAGRVQGIISELNGKLSRGGALGASRITLPGDQSGSRRAPLSAANIADVQSYITSPGYIPG